MGLLHDSGSSANTTCPMPAHLVEDSTETVVGDYTFYHFNMILSGSCAALTCLMMFILMTMHATRFSNPNEQLKIMRICTLLPLYSIFSFLSICFPDADVYLEGWIEVFQGIALYWFLMLLCDFLAPNDRHRVHFFQSLQIPSRNGQTTDGLTWLQRTWFCVLQYPVVNFIVAIAQCITQAAGIYCLESQNRHFAHLWLNIIQIISTGVAVMAILGFYKNLKSYMTEYKPLMKLLAFKLIVGLVFLEKIIFTILQSAGALKTSSTLNYADVNIGLPNMVICIQLVPFAFLFHFAYNTRMYRLSAVPLRSTSSQQYLSVESAEDGRLEKKRYQGGPLGVMAWLALVNPLDLFRDIKSTFYMLRAARAGAMDYQM
ncbi:uncharacterized protein N7459_001124 [Penicillium hispanicum]|uniref:uncharacterized protein n=1 Tax=Penicillium hispanicum TaxID=1080232 RepID=UPI0025425DF8|nr:uncharacterized protein N7459_001124 [Penicillium hispanicum]KAJ5594916.1 hypothetical protein N7459_001124 [Penicillium hispanicum]